MEPASSNDSHRDWPVARWWKFDFHAHTPASLDYGKGKDQETLRQQSPRDWLLDYMRAGIDCVAVTDHNTGEWIDKLKEALELLEKEKPEGFRPLYLFPGVEISVHGGVHVLAIFGKDMGTLHIHQLLGAVGYRGTPGASDGVTEKSFKEVVQEIRKSGGIAIPAHVDGEKGLFTAFEGTTLQQCLETELFAIEVLNPSAPKPQMYSQIYGEKEEKRPPLAEVLGSDCHHPRGRHEHRYPGSHFTWVKIGTPKLEGLIN